MSINMSYCRFQNTLEALRECSDELSGMQNLDDLSDEEKKAARRLLKLCDSLAHDWGLEIEQASNH